MLTATSAYLKNYNLDGLAKEHQLSALELWKIREEYISLLTDLPISSIETIVTKRDDLQKRTYEIYKKSPKTDSESYKQTQCALKNNEEQTFSDHEIDIMLPCTLRKNRKGEGE